MSLFVLTINNLSPALDRQHQELERIHHYLVAAVQDVRGAGGEELTAISIARSHVYLVMRRTLST